MKHIFKHTANYTGVILAIASFTIGTLLLLAYKITAAEDLLILGFYYTCLAVIVNTLMVLVLLFNAIANYKDYSENLGTIAGTLVNIPITLLYMEIAL